MEAKLGGLLPYFFMKKKTLLLLLFKKNSSFFMFLNILLQGFSIFFVSRNILDFKKPRGTPNIKKLLEVVCFFYNVTDKILISLNLFIRGSLFFLFFAEHSLRTSVLFFFKLLNYRQSSIFYFLIFFKKELRNNFFYKKLQIVSLLLQKNLVFNVLM